MSFKLNFSRKSILVFIFFLAYFLIGVSVYKDYGISNDEDLERSNGLLSIYYVGNFFNIEEITSRSSFSEYKNIDLNEYWARHYPVGFTLPAAALERILRINDEREVFFFRHLINFLVCSMGVIAMYWLAKRRFSDWRIGILAACFLILSPRFFAESFYNSKDVVLMAFFALSMNSLIGFTLNPSWRSLMLHAVVSGMAMDIRLMAIVFPIGTTLLSAIKVLRGEWVMSITLKYLMIYWLWITLFIFATWPYLWEDPLGRLSEALQYMVKLNFSVNSLYLGEIYPSNQLPWHYLPIWIAITTPILYLILFIIGGISTAFSVIQNKWRLWKSNEELQDLIFFVIAVVPVLMIMARQSVLYDGWRHAYFIYPAILMLSIKGLTLVWSKFGSVVGRFSIALIVCISLTFTTAWMIGAHPLQNVYFNSLAGKNWKDHFDVDYWGLVNRQALEYILKHDDRDQINAWSVNSNLMPIELSKKMLSSDQKERLNILRGPEQIINTDYIITTYRLNPRELSDANFKKFHDFIIDNEKIAAIYKRVHKNQ